VESAIRLSMYVNMKAAGFSTDKSAFAAKEVTVNFNRKGEWGSHLNAAYMFFNASIQGTARIGQALATSRKVQAAAVGMIAAGVILDLINSMMSGDSDDDGEDDYDQIPEHVKERNLIFMWPDGEGSPYSSIPLPWVYNVFFYAGQNASRAARGRITPATAAGNIAGALAQSANPIYASTWWQMLSPTITDPGLELSMNKDWKGDKIMPDQEPYGVDVPDSQLAFPSVNPTLKAIAEGLNTATGGDAVRPGVMDVSPETLEYMVEFLAGGVGSLFNRTQGTIGTVMRGEEIDPSRVPFVRKVMGKHTDFVGRDEYYDMREAVKLTEAQIKHYKDLKDRDTVEQIKAKYSADVKAIRIFEAADDKLRDLKKRRNAAKTQEQRNEIAEKQAEVMAKARKKYRELLEEQGE
jgi:hypothetical protein